MTFAANNQRLTNPGGPLMLLEVTNPAFAEPMRIANDTQDWVSQGLTYIGLPFGFKLPEDVSGSAPRLQLAISNVGRGLTDELERLAPGSITMAKLTMVDRLTPSVHEHAYWLPITSVSCTPTEATASAGVDELMRQQACKQVMDPHTLPGIF